MELDEQRSGGAEAVTDRHPYDNYQLYCSTRKSFQGLSFLVQVQIVQVFLFQNVLYGKKDIWVTDVPLCYSYFCQTMV